MKKIAVIALAVAGMLVSASAQSDLFSTIQYWVGTGANEAAFEIDWNNGTDLVWGYRWDGTATGEQMLDAIVAADPRLYAEVSGATDYGTAVFGLGFHQSGDQNFDLNPTLSFDSQHLAYTDYNGVNDLRTAVDAGDQWQEGWNFTGDANAGYWSYYNSTDDRLTANSSDWDYASTGMTGRTLNNGDVDGWVYSFYNGSGNDSVPGNPTAVTPIATPEPTGLALGVAGAIFLIGFFKKNHFKKPTIILSMVLLTIFAGNKSNAISMSDIQLWTGSGTNCAALVIEWNSPKIFNGTTVSAPVADKALVWGYRFNGTNATATQMLEAIAVADPKLYVVADNYYGSTFIDGIGYNLNGNGVVGVTDGTNTDYFTNGFAWDVSSDVDAATPLNRGDLYWSGSSGPTWQVWNETNDAGGFFSSPDRGTNVYATYDADTYSYTHGQWVYADNGMDFLSLTNGSWIGFSVSAAGYDLSGTNVVVENAYNNEQQAPVSPDGTYAAYVVNTNDFATQIISTNNIATLTHYNVPNAVLGPPTLLFYDIYDSRLTNEITKVVEPEYWTYPDKTTPVICEISAGGYITVKMAAPIYHNPNNPYGLDFTVFGNSFYVATGGPIINNFTDMGAVPIGGLASTFGHTTTVSVSQDGTNWFTYPYVPFLLPSDAYQWDDYNHVWKNEIASESKPVNPALNFGNTIVTNVTDQYVGANGGTSYSLQPSGFSWIQYVRIWAGTSTNDSNSSDYTVIDAIGTVHPVAVGDALSITPGNLVSGVTNLAFQNPADLNQTLISINFDSVSTNSKISTVSLHEFSAFAPVAGNVSSAYQLQSRPLAGATNTSIQADVGLTAGQNYSGSGNDLRVYQWNCTNWTSQPFTFNPANNQVLVAGVTNFTAFVVSQIVPPDLSIQTLTNGFAFQFVPVANAENILERSTDLVNWTPISTNTPASAQPVIWQDANAPAGNAFYRLELIVP